MQSLVTLVFSVLSCKPAKQLTPALAALPLLCRDQACLVLDGLDVATSLPLTTSRLPVLLLSLCLLSLMPPPSSLLSLLFSPLSCSH